MGLVDREHRKIRVLGQVLAHLASGIHRFGVCNLGNEEYAYSPTLRVILLRAVFTYTERRQTKLKLNCARCHHTDAGVLGDIQVDMRECFLPQASGA